MLISFLRTLILYILLILTVRLMGKRQIGEMEPAEFVVTMLIANLAAIPMQDGAIPLFSGLVPILVILGVELVLAAATMRSIKLRQLFCGKPVILMENGKILEKNLKKTRVNLDELTMHLREKDIFDLTTVKYAILETNGQLSTLLYAKETPAPAKEAGVKVKDTELPVTLVSGGRLLERNLVLSGRTRGWLDEAKRYYETAVQMDPDNREYQRALDMAEGRGGAYRPEGYSQMSSAECGDGTCLRLCGTLLCCNALGGGYFCCI